jgi:hypothetical protein
METEGVRTEQTALGEKERVQILLAEYASLRTEANARISSMYVVAGWSTVAVIWLLQQPWNNYSFWIGFLIWGMGASYVARILGFDTANASRRCREIEGEINKRAGEKLLLWESERGGLNRSYWRRLFFIQRSDDYSN